MANQYAGRYYDAFLDVNTKLLKQTQYVVTTDSAGLTPATLYTDRTKTTTTSAVRTTDSLGMAEFFAVPGVYYINVASSVRKVIVYEDVADTADVAEVAADIATHSADTTNVHGITDTSALETQLGAQAKADAAASASQPVDSDLTAIAALTPANDDVIQRKAGAWTNRTIAQLRTDLGVSSSTITGQYLGSASTFGALPTTDASGSPASNGDWAALTADNVGTGSVQSPQYPRGIYLYNGSAFSLALSISADGALIATNNLSDLANAATARTNIGLGNVNNTSDANKPVSTATQTALDGKQGLDADLTAISALDSTQSGVIASDGSGWINKSYGQLKTALGIVNITGQYLGSASTFAGLPTTDASGGAATNGDWAALTSDVVGTGTTQSPQYPRGIYLYNGTAFSLALSISVDGALLPANNLSDVENPTTSLTNLGGVPVGSNQWLIANVNAVTYASITRDANHAATAATVVWPDGTSGAYTADTVSTAFPGAVDAYHVTYVGSSTKTVTQPAVTRDVSGAVIAQPNLVVS